MFMKENMDSIDNSYVFSTNFYFYKGKLAVTKKPIKDRFDSLMFKFVYNRFMDYKFTQLKKRNIYKIPYEVILLVIFSFDRQEIFVALSEPYTTYFFERKYSFTTFLKHEETYN